ncbi:hypothetical protein [Desulforapulum autotrophicum]|nr:hypothetical protein [Desulforapulum autotrophicum]
MAMDRSNEDVNPSMYQSVDGGADSSGLVDYYCPHCKGKLFRGKVTELKMVCPHCNILVRSSGAQDLELAGEPEEQ